MQVQSHAHEFEGWVDVVCVRAGGGWKGCVNVRSISCTVDTEISRYCLRFILEYYSNRLLEYLCYCVSCDFLRVLGLE